MSAVVENKQEEDFPSLQLDLNTGMRRGLAGLKQKQMARCYATVVQSDYFPRLPCYKFLPSHYTTHHYTSLSPAPDFNSSRFDFQDRNQKYNCKTPAPSQPSASDFFLARSGQIIPRLSFNSLPHS